MILPIPNRLKLLVVLGAVGLALTTGSALPLLADGPVVGPGARLTATDDDAAVPMEPPSTSSIVRRAVGPGRSIAGRPSNPSIRIGPIVLYQNASICDPNALMFADFNATFGPGGILATVHDLCGGPGERFGCDPNNCSPAVITGPLYLQDSGLTVGGVVNGFRFMYASDHAVGASFVPPDLDQDGDVDLTDFALFASCFGQSAVGPCAPMDFDTSGTVTGADFAIFGQCFGGSLSPPAGGCPFGQGGIGGNQIDLNVCFSTGTNSAVADATGAIIIDDFGGNGGSSASRAIYTCLDLPEDDAPGDTVLSLIQVEVDLTADPPVWTAERFIDSMIFTGAVLKEGGVPVSADRSFVLPSGAFGVTLGSDDNTIEDLVTLLAHGGAGNANALRVLDASAVACAGNGNPCGTQMTPDLSLLFTDPGNGDCTFDNCNACAIENAGFWFVIETDDTPGEPNDTIDDALPIVIDDIESFEEVSEIGSGGGASTDVDLLHVSVPAVPPGGLHLVTYVEGVGAPPNRGNPLVRAFDSAGVELALSETDGRAENADADCPPHAGTNSIAAITITTPGDYYLGVSGGGCDVSLPATDPTNPCELAAGVDPNSVSCNDNYDPLSGTPGDPGQAGLYEMIAVLADLSPVGLEPNDSLAGATPILALPFDSDPNGGAGLFMGDGPFGTRLGDHDYYRIPDAASTDGAALDCRVRSQVDGENTSAFMIVYETDADDTVSTPTIVAVNDNSTNSSDARCLAPVQPGKDYYVMVMPVGLAPHNRHTIWRQAAGFIELDPIATLPGGGDSIPSSARPTFSGPYRLIVEQIALPPETGPFEPNDSLAQAMSNAVLTVNTNDLLPVSVSADVGDGRYGWSVADPINPVVGDIDFYHVTGPSSGDLLVTSVSPHPGDAVSIWSWQWDGARLAAAPTSRIINLGGGVSAQMLATVDDPADAFVSVTASVDPDLPFIGELLPWDVHTPGTLLNGSSTGGYDIRIRARTSPPGAAAGARMWAAYRGSLASSLLELDPDTGAAVRQFVAPTPVNGGATGLAFAATPPGHATDVLYYLNTDGGIVKRSRLWELDPNTGAFVPGAPGPGHTDLSADAFVVTAFGGTANVAVGTDGLGYAGGKLWFCNQIADKIVRFNTATRAGDAQINFLASPFSRQCRDGLDGTDASDLGSGSVLYVAARENRVIVLVDVGSAGNGPAGNGVFVNLGEFSDPTYDDDGGIANTGGLAILPRAGAVETGPSVLNVYVGNLNANLTDVVEFSESLRGPSLTVVGGWRQLDFGASALTGSTPAAFTAPLTSPTDGTGRRAAQHRPPMAR